MKRIGLIVAIATLAAATVHAAQQVEPAIPKGFSDSRVVPAGELPQAPAPQSVQPVVPQVVEPAVPRMVDVATPETGRGVPRLVMDARRGRRDADARGCLRFTSNIQVHRCAERYRPRHAGVAKTVAKPSEVTIRREERARAADLAKPDMSKAAEPAKPVETTKPAPPVAAAPKAAEPAKPAASSSTPEKPKWTDSAKGLFTKGAQRADEATK